ncbi:porin [Endozoicomonas gorgoniicola]|uniref:Porin n=1 Tax=Endozoicomonas gorgoniicola TaxID=1234144 RepID=A0ABT3N261_9GAMM|nr:porin [Endozoicomonas gorgoniicola]MCW7555727.1 porin [Endozoicomonas gorgoniicola]
MQKKLLAAVVASLVAGQAMALEVYNDDTTSLSIGGRIGVKAEKAYGSKVTGKNDSSRINFKFAHKLGNGWTGHGVAEWGFRAKDEYNALGGKEDTFFNRLGFVGLDHDTYGKITAGKSWSVMQDVNGWTDSYAIGGGNAMGLYTGRVSGDVDGSARADDVLQYRNSFGGLNVGVQYQLRGDASMKDVNDVTHKFTRKNGAGVSLSYDLPMGLSLGATYAETEYEKNTDYKGQDKSKAATVGAKFENEMLKLAATYGKFENKTNTTKIGGDLDRKSTGLELFAQVNLPQVVDGFALYTGYNQLEADKQMVSGKEANSKAEFKEVAVGAIYKTGPMQFAFEWSDGERKGHDGKKIKNKSGNTYSVNARYYF